MLTPPSGMHVQVLSIPGVGSPNTPLLQPSDAVDNRDLYLPSAPYLTLPTHLHTPPSRAQLVDGGLQPWAPCAVSSVCELLQPPLVPWAAQQLPAAPLIVHPSGAQPGAEPARPGSVVLNQNDTDHSVSSLRGCSSTMTIELGDEK